MAKKIPGKGIPGGVSVETVLASALRTGATTESPTYRGGKGVLFLMEITAEDGSVSLMPKLQAYDSIANDWYTLAQGVGMTAVGKTAWLVYPGVVEEAEGDMTDVASIPLPAVWRLQMARAGGVSMTYSVEGHFYG